MCLLRGSYLYVYSQFKEYIISVLIVLALFQDTMGRYVSIRVLVTRMGISAWVNVIALMVLPAIMSQALVHVLLDTEDLCKSPLIKQICIAHRVFFGGTPWSCGSGIGLNIERCQLQTQPAVPFGFLSSSSPIAVDQIPVLLIFVCM